MQTVKLDPRLAAVASLVKPGNLLVDIGTDHAYLPCHLVQRGVCSRAIAADLRKGPLENAKSTIAACGLEAAVSTLLSDGLDAVPAQKNCTVAFAGMGGLLIVELLSRTPWVFEPSVQIVAQPMSHAEDVRSFFFANGFSLERELCAADGRRCYCAMAARYTGEKTPVSPALPYGGLLFSSQDAVAGRYMQTQRLRLQKRYDALLVAGSEPNEAARLRAVLKDFARLLRQS